jgi:hypothetical protein
LSFKQATKRHGPPVKAATRKPPASRDAAMTMMDRRLHRLGAILPQLRLDVYKLFLP